MPYLLPGDTLRMVTSAAADVDCTVSFVEHDESVAPTATGAAKASRQRTNVTGVATTPVLATPAANKARNPKRISCVNKHASATTTIYFDHYDGATAFRVTPSFTLGPGESAVIQDNFGIELRTASGLTKSVSSMLRSVSTSDQAIPVALTALTGGILALPPSAFMRPGDIIRWRVTMSKTAAGIAAQTFEVKFGTAGTTADTTRLGTGSAFTSGTQTGVADVARVVITVIIRGPIGAACICHGSFALYHDLAATGFATRASPHAQQTSAAFDITTAGIKATLATTPGAAAVTTAHQVECEYVPAAA